MKKTNVKRNVIILIITLIAIAAIALPTFAASELSDHILLKNNLPHIDTSKIVFVCIVSIIVVILFAILALIVHMKKQAKMSVAALTIAIVIAILIGAAIGYVMENKTNNIIKSSEIEMKHLIKS